MDWGSIHFDGATTTLLIGLVVVVIVGYYVFNTMPTDGFALCQQAFGANWYPVYNTEGACRNFNGTTQYVHVLN